MVSFIDRDSLAVVHLPSFIGQSSLAKKLHDGLHNAELFKRHEAFLAPVAAVLLDGLQHEACGAVQVGIVEDDLRAFAPAFEHALQGALGSGLLHQRADLGQAGDGDEVDVGVGGERSAGWFAEAGDDVQRAARQTGFFRDIAERERTCSRGTQAATPAIGARDVSREVSVAS